MRWLSKTRYKIGFLVPTLLVYVVFIILPIFIAIGYSFTRYSGIGKARFIGLIITKGCSTINCSGNHCRTPR